MNLRTTRRRFRVPPAVHAPWLGWAWNGRLDDQRLEEQIESVARAGFGGVAIYPHHGLPAGIHSSPGWFEHVAAVSRKIRRTTLSIHLRESFEGPFAAMDDPLSLEHPNASLNELIVEETALEGLDIVPERFGLSAEPVAVFRIDAVATAAAHRIGVLGALVEPARVTRIGHPLGAAEGRGLVFRTRTIPNRLNYLDRRAAELFLQTMPNHLATHARRYLGHPVSGLYIDGIGLRLTPGALPWDPEIESLFNETRGYSLIDELPSLFYDLPGCERVRYDYWNIINDMLREGIATPVKEWCAQHRLRFGISLRALDRRDPALLENALLPVERVSDDFVLRVPYDILEAGFENPAAFGEWLVAIKRFCSECELHGPPRQAAISIGCETPILNLERATALALWLQLLGAQTVLFERLIYRPVHGLDSIELNDQEPYWRALESLNTMLARVGGMMHQGHRHADVAVLYPGSSIQALHAHPLRASGAPHAAAPDRLILMHLAHLAVALHQAGADFELVQEGTLVEAGNVDRRTLAVGHARFRVLIVPSSVNLRSQTVDVLHDFLSGGGTLLFAGSVPYLIDGVRSDTIAKLVQEYELLVPSRADLFDYRPIVDLLRARRIAPAESGEEPPSPMVRRRSTDDAEIFLAFNPSASARSLRTRLTIPFDGHVELWDPRTGDMHGLGGCSTAQPFEVIDRWEGLEARVFVAARAAFRESQSELRHDRNPGPVPLWSVSRSEPNACYFLQCAMQWGADLPAVCSVGEARAAIADKLAETGMPVSCKTRWQVEVADGVKSEVACMLLIPGDELPAEPAQGVLLDGSPLRNPHRLSYAGSVFCSYTTPKLDAGAHAIDWIATCRIAEEFFSPIVLGEFAIGEGSTAMPRIAFAQRQLDFGLWSAQGLAQYPGPVSYRGVWTVLDSPRNERVVLSASSLLGCAMLRVNGSDAGALAWRPYEFDITRFVRRGENIIEIAVAPLPGQRDGVVGLAVAPLLYVETPRAATSG